MRVHDQFLMSKAFRSQRCDCIEQSRSVLQHAHKHDGVIIYLQQEGRGVRLANKVAACSMQDIGVDDIEANFHFGFSEDNLSYGIVLSILNDLDAKSVPLIITITTVIIIISIKLCHIIIWKESQMMSLMMIS